MILVGIATWRRHELVTEKIVPAIREFTVEPCEIVVACDSFESHAYVRVHADSTVKVLGAGKCLGVAGNKNRILSHFAKHTAFSHCFLFEDDTWPIALGWDKWYVNGMKQTGVHAVCFQPVDFYGGISRRHPRRPGDLFELVSTKIDGMMMLAIDRKTIDTIGGFHEAFKKERYGNEHSEFMCRANAARLVPFTNATLVGCERWIDGIDYQEFRGIKRPADDPNGGKLLFDKYQPHGLRAFGEAKKANRQGKLYQTPHWPEEPQWINRGGDT